MAAAPETTGTEVPHDAGHSKVFPPLNPDTFAPQLIWLAIVFVALYLALSKLALPRIGEVIEERKDRVRRDLDAAERLKAETEKALGDYEKALGDARSNASSIARDTRDKLARDVEADKAKLEGQIGAKIADAESRITAMKSKALASVNEIASETVGTIVDKLIGHKATADEIRSALAPKAGE